MAKKLSSYIVSESIRNSELSKAYDIISKLLLKNRISVYKTPKKITIDNKYYYGFMAVTPKDVGGMFLWRVGNVAEVESIVFCKNTTQALVNWSWGIPADFEIEVEAKGASTTKMIKLLIEVLSGHVAMNPAEIEKFIFNSKMYEDYENIDNEVLDESKENLDALLKRKASLYQKMRYATKWKTDFDPSWQEEYDNIVNDIAKLRTKIKKNVKVLEEPDPDVQRWEEWLKRECEANPEERFEDMIAEVQKVVKGVRPLVLLCGAPGIGKTYRVMQYLKKAGLHMGDGYDLFKGSATPASLFMNLANNRHKGQIMVYDDCDDVFKDPECVNLIKAAYDSSDERWVSWNTSKPIVAPDQELAKLEQDFYDIIYKGGFPVYVYPRQFLYEGGGIIITNFKAGAIDTAVRNRASIVDLDFTNREALGVIESIIPNIKPDIITEDAKKKALAYINELIDMDAPIAITVRTFVAACEEFMLEGASDRAIRRRIANNLKLQADIASKRKDRKY